MTLIVAVVAAIVLPLLTARLIVGDVEWAAWAAGVAAVAAHTYLWKEVVTMPPSPYGMVVIMAMLILSSSLFVFLVDAALKFHIKRY